MIIGKEAKKEIKAEEVGMKQTSEPSICYIRDLKELLQKEGIYRDLYYNSFLLHGFYQYRHVVEKDGYIGVPGIFYEREAIAAKMMGFPYFIEEKNLAAMDTDHVSLAQMEKTNQNFRKPPVEGTFGYYLHAL